MIVSTDGYVCFQDKHRIIVAMPQTAKNPRSTALPVSGRKEEMETGELLSVLLLVKSIMEKEDVFEL